jgi:hypothetical protein
MAEKEKIELVLESQKKANYFPISFSDATSLLFKLSLRDDIANKYNSQVDEDILDANPAWTNEVLSGAGAYGLCFMYYQKYGRVGVMEYHAGEPPWERNRKSFKFYLDTQKGFTEIRSPENIRMDLGNSIMNLVEHNEKIIDVAHEFDERSLEIRKIITYTVFGLK